MEKFEIRKIDTKETPPFDLLYLADPSEEAVSDYLKRGTCYIGIIRDKVVGVCVLLPTRPFTVELVNLAIDEEYQRQGYAKRMIEHVVNVARESNFNTMEVGTGNAGIGQLALYQKCGFTITSVDFDFFRKHYPEPIFENGIECRHMVRLSMDL